MESTTVSSDTNLTIFVKVLKSNIGLGYSIEYIILLH